MGVIRGSVEPGEAQVLHPNLSNVPPVFPPQTGTWSTATTGTAGCTAPSTPAAGHRWCWSWAECWAPKSSKVRGLSHTQDLFFLFLWLQSLTSVALWGRKMEASQVNHLRKLGGWGVWSDRFCRIHRGDVQLLRNKRSINKPVIAWPHFLFICSQQIFYTCSNIYPNSANGLLPTSTWT